MGVQTVVIEAEKDLREDLFSTDQVAKTEENSQCGLSSRQP